MEGFVNLIERGIDIIPPLQALIVAICFVLGLIMIARSVPRAAVVFESRSLGVPPMNASYRGPAASFLIGCLLISLSAAISAFLMSFFQQDQTVAASEVFAYAPTVTEPLTEEMSQRAVIGLIRFAQFIGFLGFVRGLFLLHRASNHATIGDAGRGTTHLIAGTAAMNIVVVLGMIERLMVG